MKVFQERWVTPRVAVSILGLSDESIRKLIASGDLRAIRVEGHNGALATYAILASDAEKLAARRKAKQP